MADLNCIFIPLKHRFCGITYYTYNLRPSVAHFLHLIVKTKTRKLENITIHNNLIPLPKQYDGITFPFISPNGHISLRKSYFNKSELNMNDITAFLEILAHECTHVKQIDRYSFLGFHFLPYVFAHLYYYCKAKSHDKSHLEYEPILRQSVFLEMNKYLNKTVAPYALARVLANEKLTECEKILQLNKLVNKYKITQKTD